MAAVGLLVRATLRRRWRALAVLALVTLVACGFVLTAATGARRTQTAWSRLERRTDAPQALVSARVADVDAARAAVADRPDVAGFGAFSWMPASVEGMPDADRQGLFAGLGPGFPYDVWRPLIERGRNTDPARAEEFWSRKTIAPTRVPGSEREGAAEGAARKGKKKQG